MIKEDTALLKTLTVEQFLAKYGHRPLTMKSSLSVIQAAEVFSITVDGLKYSMAIVVDDDDLVCGVISLGDIVHALYEHPYTITKMGVNEIMSTTNSHV